MAISQILLDTNRRELLDLSAGNRLLAIPVQSATARLVHLHDERIREAYRLLVSGPKALTFLPLPGKAAPSGPGAEGAADDEPAVPQPDNDLDPDTGKLRRHSDTGLQTALKSETLQTRLLGLHRDTQTLIEEPGGNTLYLALGQLRWFDEEEPARPRHAPLILVPVELVRAAAGDRFKLRAREEDYRKPPRSKPSCAKIWTSRCRPFPNRRIWIRRPTSTRWRRRRGRARPGR